MRNNDVEIATNEVLLEFKNKVANVFGLTVMKIRPMSMYVRDGLPTINATVNYNGVAVEIRLGLLGDNVLTVGWAGNNLIRVDSDSHSISQIETIKFVADIFNNSEKWVELLLSLDVNKVVLAEEAEKIQVLKELNKIKLKRLKAFEDVKIEVGDSFHSLTGSWDAGKVLRMASSKVQLAGGIYSKEEIGEKLLEGKWQAKKQ